MKKKTKSTTALCGRKDINFAYVVAFSTTHIFDKNAKRINFLRNMHASYANVVEYINLLHYICIYICVYIFLIGRNVCIFNTKEHIFPHFLSEIIARSV